MSYLTGKVPDAAQVADRLAILDVLATHSRGLDRLDPDAIRAAYWPEAEVDYGSYTGGAYAFAEVVVEALASRYELTRHCLGNTLFAFSADNAMTETCVTAAHLLRGAAEEMLFYGRYLDRLEKRGTRWRILHRQVVIDWSKRLPVADERASSTFAALARGARGDADPLYRFLASQG